MAVYISMGVPAPYLLAASIMAAPASLVIAKIVWPETEESATKGAVKLEVKKFMLICWMPYRMVQVMD